ncbi:EamA family transporter [Spirillospora sp. NPDC048911]|uniref:EamA family transporter n=1 Tax=Spirillospora sp. NPDC048911 TaxID=3364527 RepID=UPI003722CE7E
MASIAVSRPASFPHVRDLALTAYAPATWGTTYVVTTTMLPPDRPLLAATLRALPAGLILLAVTRRLPFGSWWWKSAVLGLLNFGAFFPLLFFAAYRLPGGVAATIGSVQPLIVALLSLGILRLRPTRRVLVSALVGTGGVALLTLTSEARIDPLGIGVMLVATSLMGLAVVLTKRWGRPDVPLLAVTGWQLTFGGLMIAPFTLLNEGLPSTLTAENIAGFTYLGVIGTAIAYVLWNRGIGNLTPTSVSLLGLVNPLVATLAGIVFLSQTLTPWQTLGLMIALGALVAGQARRQAPSSAQTFTADADSTAGANPAVTADLHRQH